MYIALLGLPGIGKKAKTFSPGLNVSKKKPSETDSIQSQIISKPRHLVGKHSTKNTIKDISSDSQVNSNFSYRWSPVTLIFNIYFYPFLYLYITRRTINSNILHLKSLKSQSRRAATAQPATYLREWGGGGGGGERRGTSTSLRSTNPRP